MSKKKKKTREVEFARLWSDNTWDTDTDDIDKQLVDEAEKTGDYRALEKVYRKTMLNGVSDEYKLVAFLVFHIPPEEP